MISNKLNVLKLIANKFNENKIVWVVGASTLLYLKGLVNSFSDLDILVLEKDINKSKNILLELGTLNLKTIDENYQTKYFYEFNVLGVT